MVESYSDLKGKNVLVTGGTGTIGSAIVERLLRSDAAQIRIYSRDESKQYDLKTDLPDDDRLRFLIGDTRDLERLRRAVHRVHVIFHAAAMKHVLSCEYNPFEAVKTNVFGTQNVIEAAMDAEVERVLFASSDKAANPTSTMGASKLMAEKLITAGNAYRGTHPTIFATVRFGNVVGSRGSVLPLFVGQIASGGPVTITDRRMTRFIMSIDRAVDLMFSALELAHGGEVFVLKMPAIRIEDLAALLLDHLPERHGLARDDIEVKEIGAQPGEKHSEELVTDEELSHCLETDEMFIIIPRHRTLLAVFEPFEYPGARPATDAVSSDRVEPMQRDELHRMLVDANVLEPA